MKDPNALVGAGTYSVAVVVVGTNLVETTDVIVFVVVVVGTLCSIFANAVSVDYQRRKVNLLCRRRRGWHEAVQCQNERLVSRFGDQSFSVVRT